MFLHDKTYEEVFIIAEHKGFHFLSAGFDTANVNHRMRKNARIYNLYT